MATSKAIPISLLVLRIITFSVCFASAVFLGVDNLTVDGDKESSQDINAFKFVVAAAAIGAAYSLIQLPSNIYYVLKEKRLIGMECMPQFDFFADKIVSLLLAAGVGAGFGAGFELKKIYKMLVDLASTLLSSFGALSGANDYIYGGDDSFQGLSGELEEGLHKANDFFNKAISATGILFIGAVCMAVVSVITSITRTNSNST